MIGDLPWNRQTYHASLSSRCWCFTPYDRGWRSTGKAGEDPATDEELRQIVQMEQQLGVMPEWVGQVVEGPLRWVGFCGHCTFPQSFLDAVEAIGVGRAPALNHTCYTVDRRRKLRMTDYALCLDGWSSGADAEAVAGELLARSQEATDWLGVCRGIWSALGERTELKELLVERMLHRTRYWLKATVWDDDRGFEFCRDAFLGPWRERDPLLAENGNPRFRAGSFEETASPRVQRLEARLNEICPDWEWFRTVIVEFSWPCAPKAFRFMEKTLWCIGRQKPVISLPSFPLDHPEEVPSFLDPADTHIDREPASQWWGQFLAALRDWWQGRPLSTEVARQMAARLGPSTPVKRWLVRLLVRRLEVLADGHLGGMVNP